MTSNGFAALASTALPEIASEAAVRSAGRASPSDWSQPECDPAEIEISIVVPVYNGAETVGRLVNDLRAVFDEHAYEIVLVNDGSADHSEHVCQATAGRFPRQVTFVQLAKNFGEHQAVLAGLAHARGKWVGVVDDDGQNPPEELHRMWRHIQKSGDDVVYGCYREKQHSTFRNAGSRIHNWLSSFFLDKPRGLYLSSFKVMSRTLVSELVRQAGPFAYLDGAILRATSRIGELEVTHRERQHGRSGYTFRKLLRLSLAMCFGYSLWPLRMLAAAGGLTCLAAVVAMIWLLVEPGLTSIESSVVLGVAILFASGVQLAGLGLVGEYVGRLWLRESGSPAYVVRYVRGGGANA